MLGGETTLYLLLFQFTINRQHLLAKKKGLGETHAIWRCKSIDGGDDAGLEDVSDERSLEEIKSTSRRTLVGRTLFIRTEHLIKTELKSAAPIEATWQI